MHRSILAAVVLISIAVCAVAQAPRCDINVCFALDSSAGVPENFFSTGQDLVENIVERLASRTGSRLSFAAVQYSTTTEAIQPMTPYRGNFQDMVRNAKPDGNRGTFVTAGMNYSIAQAISAEDPTAQPKTAMVVIMVVIGSGENSIGTEPRIRGELYEQAGGMVFAVGVGNTTAGGLLDIAGQEDRVFVVEQGEPVHRVGLDVTVAMCGK